MSELFENLMTAHDRALSAMKSKTTNRYPEDFKSVAVETCRGGVPLAQIAKATGVNINTISSWLRKGSSKKEHFHPPCPDKVIPVEWIDNRKEEVVIRFKSGTTMSLPASALNSQIMGFLERAS